MFNSKAGCLSRFGEKRDAKKVEHFPRGSPVLFSKVGV
jgi:hypothetical protein